VTTRDRRPLGSALTQEQLEHWIVEAGFFAEGTTFDPIEIVSSEESGETGNHEVVLKLRIARRYAGQVKLTLELLPDY